MSPHPDDPVGTWEDDGGRTRDEAVSSPITSHRSPAMYRALLWRLLAAIDGHLGAGADPTLAAHHAALQSHISTQIGDPPADLVNNLLTAAAGPLSPAVSKVLAEVHAHVATVPALAAVITPPATVTPVTTPEAAPAATSAAPAQAAPVQTTAPAGFAPTS